MKISDYDQMTSLQLDAMGEIGTIGSGNAATALSEMIQKPVKIKVPVAVVLGFDEVFDMFGGPENIVAGIQVRLNGDINGVMLYMQDLEFVNLILESLFGTTVASYEELDEMGISALNEIGNITIGTYMRALSSFIDAEIIMSTPAMCINMAGGIFSEPLAQVSHASDKILLLDGVFCCGDQQISSKLILLPDFDSLNLILERLGVGDSE